MTEFPMLALRNARLKYHEKEPNERFKKGDRVRAFAGKHAGRVGTIKKIGKARLTMSWDDDGAGGRTFCEASHAELLRVYQEAQATAPPSTADTNTGTGTDPEHTQEGDVYDMIKKRLNDLTMDLTAMLRMCNNPSEACQIYQKRKRGKVVYKKHFEASTGCSSC